MDVTRNRPEVDEEGNEKEDGVEPEAERKLSSPDAARLSLAAAMTLGLVPGRFYRDARLTCINLLQTYPGGCIGRCAYCGLAKGRAKVANHHGSSEKSSSFIRVTWPTHPLDQLIERMEVRRDAFTRICLSMVTRSGALDDLVTMTRRLRARLDVPLSALLTPTITERQGFLALRDAGIDRVGIAVDAATPELFDQLRGQSARGPHRWHRYWESFEEAVDVFGPFMVGCHLIVGLGETERQMVETFGRLRSLQCVTHLFSFFPEAGSTLEDRQPPPMGQYRRMQLARFLIDEGLTESSAMTFNDDGRLREFGIDAAILDDIIERGEPFRTSGCPGEDGQVACNRPFANCRPGPDIRNYPFPLEPSDVAKVREELWS